MVQDDDELVSADACHQIARPRRRAETPGHGEEQLVTQAVAVTVVDELEAVDVKEEERDEAALLLRTGEDGIQLVLRVRTVGKTRERVMRRRVREALFGTRVRTQSAEHPPRPAHHCTSGSHASALGWRGTVFRDRWRRHGFEPGASNDSTSCGGTV